MVKQVAQSLVAAAKNGSLSAEGAERIVLMRPWLEEDVQLTLDTAVRACRQRGLQSAIKPAVQIAAVMASGCDGAGAQSDFVILKRGRKLALAALLVKHGFGVRDAWLREDLSRREIDELLAEIGGQADSKRWPKEYAFLQSWFEQGEAVAGSCHTARTKNQREEAVLRDILPQRRER